MSGPRGFSRARRPPGRPRSAEASRSIFFVAVVGAVFALASAISVHAQLVAPLRVLFIGNSLTSANDLPGMVASLARVTGEPRIECEAIAFPNYSLEDHWNRGDAARAIARGGWTTVILQQGPSALPDSQELLREYTRKFDAVIRRAGAKTDLYMVWPFSNRRGDFDGVKASYQAAARDVGGEFLPVGEAWRAVWRRDARITLYGPDGFHPTPAATYLAAAVIYQRLTGKAPPAPPSLLSIPAERTSVIRQAASDVAAIK